MRQIAYFLPAKSGNMLVITLSTLAEQGKKYDAVMEKAMFGLTLTK
ncbi:MAG: hypothetical protein H7Y38_05570 [Armatimonadetes bacterium]|nr:hypothetical protein [Armatimonadota bacterium]